MSVLKSSITIFPDQKEISVNNGLCQTIACWQYLGKLSTSEAMSKEQNKNYGKSIRTKLLNVARKENVFNQTILTRYFQERLLYRISQTHYRGNFYLKGGALIIGRANRQLIIKKH